LDGLVDHLPARERVYRGLSQATIQSGGATPEGLAIELELKVGTVKNYFTALHKQGRAAPLGAGRWATFKPSYQSCEEDEHDM
jgi:hypothetical protein